MRGLLPGLLVIAACYQPSVRSNVPCSAAGQCPEGQLCVGGFCTAQPGTVPDAEVPDSPPGVLDRDSDRVADDKDNCPDLANPDQANEDADKFGDACDSCPQVSDNGGGDSDGDHVGDACDPNPGVRDTVWVYSGFHTGLPTWARSSNWTAAGDKLRANAPQNTGEDSEFMIPPFTTAVAPDNFTVTITVVIDQVLGTTGDHSFGIEIYDMTADKGVDCGLGQAPAGSNSVLFLQDDFNSLNQLPPFTWAPGAEFRISLTRHLKKYTCSVTGPAGSQTASGDSNVVPRDGNTVDFWAYGVIAQFGSVQIIGTP